MSAPTVMIVRASAAALAILFMLQLVRPELKNPPVKAKLNVPPEVEAVLRNSCYACHSNETKLAWFDRVVPAYQLVAFDVKKARQVLNFSELGGRSNVAQNEVLFEAVSQIQLGAMPLPRYLLLHREAAVTAHDLAVLRQYLLAASAAAPATQPSVDAADTQYRQWIAGSQTSHGVQAARNGIPFPSGYRNWKAISSTDRTDQDTFKMILGNDVAIRAIADHNINPWPDGTVLAKVSWQQGPDAQGVTRTGEFGHAGFMIKNSRKYASTAGWGWAQWSGLDLKPYGKDADFVKECVACHAPLSRNDYVFTMPMAVSGDTK
jgi:hypothetical protein